MDELSLDIGKVFEAQYEQIKASIFIKRELENRLALTERKLKAAQARIAELEAQET